MNAVHRSVLLAALLVLVPLLLPLLTRLPPVLVLLHTTLLTLLTALVLLILVTHDCTLFWLGMHRNRSVCGARTRSPRRG